MTPIEKINEITKYGSFRARIPVGNSNWVFSIFKDSLHSFCEIALLTPNDDIELNIRWGHDSYGIKTLPVDAAEIYRHYQIAVGIVG